MIEGRYIEIVNLLGTGQSATVYEGEYQDKSVVVKLFRPKQEQRLTTEMETLQQLASVPYLNGLVPALLAVTDNNRSLVLQPVGVPFGLRGPTADDFAQILSIMKKIHALGLVHRDLRLCNIFRHPETQKVGTLPPPK